jgi:hypothetical protein
MCFYSHKNCNVFIRSDVSGFTFFMPAFFFTLLIVSRFASRYFRLINEILLLTDFSSLQFRRKGYRVFCWNSNLLIHFLPRVYEISCGSNKCQPITIFSIFLGMILMLICTAFIE